MGEMRKLGILLQSCQQLSGDNQMCGYDVLDPIHFRLVTDAINETSSKEHNGGMKARLKLNVSM
jgi:hypothetical protein